MPVATYHWTVRPGDAPPPPYLGEFQSQHMPNLLSISNISFGRKNFLYICFRHRVLLPNEERVPLLDHTHFMTHQNGSLTIVNVSDVDSGPYVCRAWNAAGSDCVYIDVYNMHPREYLPATSMNTAIAYLPPVHSPDRPTLHPSLVPTPCCFVVTRAQGHTLTPALPHTWLPPSHHHVDPSQHYLLTPSLLPHPHIPQRDSVPERDPGISAGTERGHGTVSL